VHALAAVGQFLALAGTVLACDALFGFG